MARTLKQYVSDVVRETRTQASFLEAQQAFRDAISKIDASANWEFLEAESLINVQAPYVDGTVACAAGTVNCTLTTAGTGTDLWGPYAEIQFASRKVPYKILQSTGHLTFQLTTGLSGLSGGSADITADTFKVYFPVYALPSDCEPGRDLKIKGPLGSGENGLGDVNKIERTKLEKRILMKFATAAYPFWYSDAPYDETNRLACIRFEPYPTVSGEYRLIYYKRMVVPTSLTSTVIIPESFERLPILMAASQYMQANNMQGWMEKRQEAANMLTALYNRHAASSAYEDVIEATDSSRRTFGEFGIDGTLFIRDM
jgi:hypothetical protein